MRSFAIIFLVFFAFPALVASKLEDVDVKTTLFNGPDNGHAITGYQKGIPPTRFLKTRKTSHDEERNNPVTSSVESKKISDWASATLAEWKALPSSDHVLSHVRVGDADKKQHMKRQNYFMEALEKKEMEPVIAYFMHDGKELLHVLDEHYGLNVVARALLAARKSENEQVRENAENLRSLIINHWVQTDKSYSEVFNLLKIYNRPEDFVNWKMLEEFINRKTGKGNNVAILVYTLVEGFETKSTFLTRLSTARSNLAGTAQEETLLELENMSLQYFVDSGVSINDLIYELEVGMKPGYASPALTVEVVAKFSLLRLQEGAVSDYGMLAFFLSRQLEAQYHEEIVKGFEQEFFKLLVARSVTPGEFVQEIKNNGGQSPQHFVKEFGDKYTEFFSKSKSNNP